MPEKNPEAHGEVSELHSIPARTEVIKGIYENPLSSSEKRVVDEKIKFYETGDREVFDTIQKVREEIGTIEGWKDVKEKARKELAEVPSDVLETLLEKFAPFTKNLPAGHSKGHFLRDTVNLSMIFQDPSIEEYDAVEIFVGMLGGMYHDIGNSVVDRYAEPRRFSGHAEIGAHLFGSVSGELIGENLRKMAQLAIAGHTHYTKDRVIEKDGESITAKPYEDEVVDGERMAFWWTRQADRLDAQGPIMDVRHLITKTDPTEDFDGREFHTTWDDPEDDFKHQFSPNFRSKEDRDSRDQPEKVNNVLEHVKMFAESNFNPDLPYSKHDNPFYKRLIEAAAEEQDEFIEAVTAKSLNISGRERQASFEKFFRLCKLVEPGIDIHDQIDKMRKKFLLLTEEEQNQWANGFRILTDRLYPRMYRRVKTILEYPQPAKIRDKDQQAQHKVKDIVDNHMYPLAVEVWEQLDPSRLSA